MKDMVGQELNVGDRVFLQGELRAVGKTDGTENDMCAVQLDGGDVAMVHTNRIMRSDKELGAA